MSAHLMPVAATEVVIYVGLLQGLPGLHKRALCSEYLWVTARWISGGGGQPQWAQIPGDRLLVNVFILKVQIVLQSWWPCRLRHGVAV